MAQPEQSVLRVLKKLLRDPEVSSEAKVKVLAQLLYLLRRWK